VCAGLQHIVVALLLCFILTFRCGMSGEPAPRFIIKSQVTMKPYGQVCFMLFMK